MVSDIFIVFHLFYFITRFIPVKEFVMDGIINVTIVRYGALEKVKINTISIVQGLLKVKSINIL